MKILHNNSCRSKTVMKEDYMFSSLVPPILSTATSTINRLITRWLINQVDRIFVYINRRINYQPVDQFLVDQPG